MAFSRAAGTSARSIEAHRRSLVRPNGDPVTGMLFGSLLQFDAGALRVGRSVVVETAATAR